MGTNLGLGYCLPVYFKQYTLFVPINASGSFLSRRYLSTVWIHKFSLFPIGIFATPISSSSISEDTKTSICIHASTVQSTQSTSYLHHKHKSRPDANYCWPSPKKQYSTDTEIILRTNQTISLPRLLKTWYGTVRCLLPSEGSSLYNITFLPSNLFKVILMPATIYAGGKVYTFY